jgi:F0F1-type ATP synthase membrane subunit a
MRQSLACVLLVCVLLRVASTPSAITVASGDHVVSIKKSGFEEWNRKVTVSPPGHINLNAELVPEFK